jgi:hypothetical protein
MLLSSRLEITRERFAPSICGQTRPRYSLNVTFAVESRACLRGPPQLGPAPWRADLFKGDLVSDVEPRHRAATARDPSLGLGGDHFIQRQIRPPATRHNNHSACFSNREMLPPVGIAAALPWSCHRRNQLITVLRPTSKRSAASCRDAPPATASIARRRKSSENGLGIPRPSKSESMRLDSLIYKSSGIPRFHENGICSRQLHSDEPRRRGTIA